MSPRNTWARAMAYFVALAALMMPLRVRAQSSHSTSTESSSNAIELRVGMATSVAGFKSRLVLAGPTDYVQHYGVTPGFAVGLSYVHASKRTFGWRVDADMQPVMTLDDRVASGDIDGASAAMVGAVSLTISPAQLCASRCVSLSVGPGVGLYSLDGYSRGGADLPDAQSERGSIASPRFTRLGASTMQRQRDVIMPTGERQYPFALRMGVQYRLPKSPVTLSVVDYRVKFKPMFDGPGITPLHHLFVSAGFRL